jgi:serine/threonine-protein kinase
MDESPIVPGYRLGRYELLCLIASGGMASVWLARLLGVGGFEKLVAVKTIRADLIKDPRFQEMFLDEARIASGIEHPNVGHIVDLGQQDENVYIIMEWIDGESLARISTLVQKRGMSLPLPLALRVIADTCSGLHAAHELRNVRGASLGIVHRDVSPDNILITVAGTVKVIDFGIAKAQQRGASETAAGTLKGKLRYMAPEQVSGVEVDRRADIWAAGICLVELLTGRDPYSELTEIEVMRRLMGPAPAPNLDELGLPASLRSILDRSLVADPARRFETAADMRRAIENAISALGVPGTSEDLADFVRTNFADLARRRREAVSKAMDAADQRAGAPPSTRVPEKSGDVPEEEIALAPTQVVDTEASPMSVRSTTGGTSRNERILIEPAPSRRLVYAGAGAAALAVVVAAVWIGREPTASTDPPPPSATVATTATPTVAPHASSVHVAPAVVTASAPPTTASPSSVASVISVATDAGRVPSATTASAASTPSTKPVRDDAGASVRPSIAPSASASVAPAASAPASAPSPVVPPPDEPTPP